MQEKSCWTVYTQVMLRGLQDSRHRPTSIRLIPGFADPRLTNGQAGTLMENADTLTMKKGANITADNGGLGNAGDIIINVRDLFVSRDGATTGSISSQSALPVIRGISRSGHLA